ncbi:TDT family transporter [Ferrimonas senticii]|uniref:TDT family transporter n=1 Tax=Ferrimonas senticii TaxID=394566 RepID=UPI000428594A|nr:TDT family transporter [Ferrimonas senticii]
MSVTNVIKQVPTPIAGLALGIASLGGIIDGRFTFDGQLALVTASISALLLLALALKFALAPKLLKADLAHAVVGSVLPTAAMALMLIAATVKPLLPGVTQVLWPLAVLLHLLLLASFVFHRVREPIWSHMVPSWFVPPVGIIVAAVSCPSPEYAGIATALLYFGMVAFAILLPAMLYRLIFHPNIAEAAKPTIAILAAPASLSMVGYLKMVQQPSAIVLMLLFGVALLMTMVVYGAFFHLLKLKFSPAYAAFTFPLVISSAALYQFALATEKWGLAMHQQLHAMADIELAIATLAVSYVALHYVNAYRPGRSGASSTSYD